MVDLNPNIRYAPTDPDTLKILEKIKKDFNETKESLNDTQKINEAKTAVLQGIERRHTDPSRLFVNESVKTNPTDKKVTVLQRKITSETGETSLASLSNRAKKHA
jgi:hypothetical protein